MFAASWRDEQDSLDRINAKVQERRVAILRQIDQLPLGRRDSESWGAFYGKAVKG